MRNMEFSAYKTIDNPRRAKRRRSCNTHASSPRSGANAQRPQKRTRTEDEHPVGSSTPRQPRLYGKTPMATVLNHPHYGVLQHGPNPVDPRELHRRELVFHTTYPGMPDYHVGDKNAATERQPKLESLSPKSPPPPDIRGVRGQERPAERRSMVEISSSDDDDMGDIPYAPVDKREAVGGETEVSRGGRCYKDATAQGSARDSDKVTPRNMKSVTDDDWDPSEDEIADPGSGASDSFGHGVRPGRRRVNQKRRALEQSRTNNAQFDGGRDSTGFDIATPPAESLLHVQNDLVTLWAPRKTNKVEPEFRKGKRLVKRDGYSMTRMLDPSSLNLDKSDFLTASSSKRHRSASSQSAGDSTQGADGGHA